MQAQNYMVSVWYVCLYWLLYCEIYILFVAPIVQHILEGGQTFVRSKGNSTAILNS